MSLPKKIFYLIIIALLVLILIPILLQLIIFNNGFISNVSNDGWANYFEGI